MGHPNFSNSDATLPAVNIKETENSYEVEMAAPGMKKDDFKIELDNNVLTISSEKAKKPRKAMEMKNTAEGNSVINRFSAAFTLPKEVVDEDKIEAHYREGVLQLRIPKKKWQSKNRQER